MTQGDENLLEDDEQENEPEEDEAENEGEEEELPAASEQPIVTADDAMTLEEARTLTGRRGARVVLLMGEAETGKTALTAALWQRFLQEDGLAGHRLAGSRTALGFERRAHWARLEAGQPEAHFPSTRPEEGGVLHLRVLRPDGERVELLLSDLAGEQFERVREGSPLLDEIPWAARADRFAIVVDAMALSRPGASEIPVTRAERLLKALRVPRIVRDSARVAVVVTKGDALNEAGETALARHRPVLIEFAQESDSEATQIQTAAVPNDATDPQGLGDLITWLCRDDHPHGPARAPKERSVRSIADFHA